jgi:hypothetical protein
MTFQIRRNNTDLDISIRGGHRGSMLYSLQEHSRNTTEYLLRSKKDVYQ